MSQLKRPLEDDKQSNDLVLDLLNQNGALNSEPQKPNDLKERQLNLKWATRVQLKNQLDKHSGAYYVDKADEKEKERMIEENYTLIKILMNLPSDEYQEDASTSKQNSAKRQKTTENESQTDNLILGLPWMIRDKIVDVLFKNHHVLVFKKHLDKDIKLNLIKENYELSQILNTLEVKKPVVKEITNYDNHLANDNLNSTMNHDTMVKEIVDLKEMINQIAQAKTSSANNFSFGVIVPKEMVFKASFNLDALQESDDALFSEPIDFRGVAWYIKMGTKENTDDGLAYLACHLFCDSEQIKCDADLTFEIINHQNQRRNYVKSTSVSYQKAGAKGFSNFIAIDELLAESENLMKDGNIDIEVTMKIESFSKKSDRNSDDSIQLE